MLPLLPLPTGRYIEAGAFCPRSTGGFVACPPDPVALAHPLPRIPRLAPCVANGRANLQVPAMDHTAMSMPMSMAPAPDAAAGSHSEAAAMSSSASMMAMTFFQARGTPLFAAAWAPQSGAAYVATCLFLITLGVILRCLLALRPLLEDIVWRGPPPPPPASAEDGEDEDEDDDEQQKHPADCEILFPAGKPESNRPGARARHRLHSAAGHHPPSASRTLWIEIRRRGRASRFGVSAGRAVLELLLAVVGYLLCVVLPKVSFSAREIRES